VVAAIGVVCLPIGFGVSPKRDLSLFNNLADMGSFVNVGILLITLGVISLGLSSLVPSDLDD
jgi:hypothetical protein